MLTDNILASPELSWSIYVDLGCIMYTMYTGFTFYFCVFVKYSQLNFCTIKPGFQILIRSLQSLKMLKKTSQWLKQSYEKQLWNGCNNLCLTHHLITPRKARVAHWWEHSPPTIMARVQILASTPYVGWVCCWFSLSLQEVFLWVLQFSPLLKN